MIAMPWLVLLPLVAVLALLLGYFGSRAATARTLGDAETRASRILDDAKRLVDQARTDADAKGREAESKVRSAELEAKELALKVRADLDQEARVRQREIQEVERRVIQQEEQLSRRLDQLDRRETDVQARDRAVAERERSLGEKEARLGSALEEQRRKLESIAGLTSEEARRQVMAQAELESRREAQLLGMRLEEEARETAHVKAKEVLATTIQRLAPDYTVETAVSIVDLPSDDMKGRIIGREGRNIRAFEAVTGVNLIIDDTPEAVLLSCFDPVRREIGRLTLEKLVSDGRIHPARIEETYDRAKQEVEGEVRRAGEDACLEVGITDLHPELVRVLGRLKYRTSYGQNVLRHLVETAHLAGIMASELGMDVALAKRCGFLHDIGKALTHEVEGSHAIIGAELARRLKERPEVVHAIEAHHGEVEQRTIEAVLTQAADAISGGRPGARRETLESYVKRLERLEEIAGSYPGVDKVFAMQAGREVRIMVKPEDVDDVAAQVLARDMAKRVEQELQYPGQIKITVVREIRSIEYAK